jgi:hypothetical protein
MDSTQIADSMVLTNCPKGIGITTLKLIQGRRAVVRTKEYKDEDTEEKHR